MERTYIRCTRPCYLPLETTVDWLFQQPGWNYIELPSGHDAPITAPDELTDILLQIE